MKLNSFNIEPIKLAPAIYLVPTPIGNLEDITIRALRVLASADVVACEDTRHTGNLLKQYGINAKKFDSFHEHNEKTKASALVSLVDSGKSVALVTDAGSPGISDPGYRLVHQAIESGAEIVPLPGATAFVPALTASGMAVDSFVFLGFPPQKKGRQTFMKALAEMQHTAILYESPYRAAKLAEEIVEYCGAARRVCFCREISKVYEEFIRGTAEECQRELSGRQSVKGEFVVIVGGAKCL